MRIYLHQVSSKSVIGNFPNCMLRAFKFSVAVLASQMSPLVEAGNFKFMLGGSAPNGVRVDGVRVDGFLFQSYAMPECGLWDCKRNRVGPIYGPTVLRNTCIASPLELLL